MVSNSCLRVELHSDYLTGIYRKYVKYYTKFKVETMNRCVINWLDRDFMDVNIQSRAQVHICRDSESIWEMNFVTLGTGN